MHSSFLSTQQAASFLKITPIHLLRSISSGEIPAARVGHHCWLREDDLIHYIESFSMPINPMPSSSLAKQAPLTTYH